MLVGGPGAYSWVEQLKGASLVQAPDLLVNIGIV